MKAKDAAKRRDHAMTIRFSADEERAIREGMARALDEDGDPAAFSDFVIRAAVARARRIKAEAPDAGPRVEDERPAPTEEKPEGIAQ